MGRLTDTVHRWWSGPETTAAYTLPSWSGDYAQVASLPSEVAEAFGIYPGTDRVTRKQAMAIPAVRRGRQVIAGTIGGAGLVATRRRGDQAPQRVTRPLLTQLNPNVTNAWLLTWTVDTLLFYGVAWWLVTARDTLGYPTSVVWVQPYRVQVTTDGTILVDNVPVRDADLIRFDGPDEGLLVHSSRAIITYTALEDAVRKFARLDVPLGWLEDVEGSLDTGEVQTMLNSWEAARRARTTGYIPRGLKYVPNAATPGAMQLAEARGFQAAEIARALNLPAVYVNAPSGDSLTYATTESNRRELSDITLAPFTAAIGQRLSMPDVTPGGTTVTVDLARFLRGDLRQILDAGAVAISSGQMTVDEVRDQWLDLPPIGQPDPDPEPDPTPDPTPPQEGTP